MADLVKPVGIDEIIQQVAGKTTPNPDPSKTDDVVVDNKEIEENLTTTEEDSEEAKQNAAFAKMRVENKTLKAQLSQLESQLAEVNKRLANPNPDQTKTEVKKDEEMQTSLEERLAKIEKQLTQTTQELEQERTEKQKQVIINNLTTLKNQYALTPNDLVQFAEDAEAQGYDLSRNPENIMNIYRVIYMDKIVEAEVNKKLKEQGLITGDSGASTGPKGAKRNPGGTVSFNEIVNQVTKTIK